MTTHVPNVQMTYDPVARRAVFSDSVSGRQFVLSNVTETQARNFRLRAVELLAADCRETTQDLRGRPQ